jgi:hypothetical protein
MGFPQKQLVVFLTFFVGLLENRETHRNTNASELKKRQESKKQMYLKRPLVVAGSSACGSADTPNG